MPTIVRTRRSCPALVEAGVRPHPPMPPPCRLPADATCLADGHVDVTQVCAWFGWAWFGTYGPRRHHAIVG